ncbi:uncharacterized protein [Amphiura filiformis]|uniref:uncharacterized protein isoform X2 n=1 Tax=Amphiura filiformis TaxID=82378 RepID=UPI003B228F57
MEINNNIIITTTSFSNKYHQPHKIDEGFEEIPAGQSIAMDSNLFSTSEPLKKRVRRCRKSRPRRRKAKLHRLEPDQNGNNWRYSIGAPRNDNEFLLNQSLHGCFQETDPEVAFPYATSDDEGETCPICHHTEPRKDSGVESEGVVD